ncbi:hypothetical protein JOY44_07660 [Phormidium sp. CLA17]|uniref:hypothetical protein n=1 Tax=Leptolyngbya sp. Cla-17 TaxID=2803751 RepID=UPI001491712C|nr:hypothetical protein [Leptolyngbya sp. Cla-17]MBM0741491.1 hypothetical protein [Leptolyngbya sp. Cla-17]
MLPNLLLSFSNWNPQFFREVKGRLKNRNLTLTVLFSFLAQFALLFFFWAALPTPKVTASSHYCTGKELYNVNDCVLDAQGNILVNWQLWWTDLFHVLTWMLPFILIVAGVYLLINDLAKEEQRGTLNFIRLSPQASQTILLGKLLGVPVLVYLGILLAVPLQLGSAGQGGVDTAELLSLYLVVPAISCVFYTGAIFYAFLGGTHGWLGAAIVSGIYAIFYQIWQGSRYSPERDFIGPDFWYSLPIASNLGLLTVFTLGICTVATFWFWQTINRRFCNPNLTLISKRQSYAMTICIAVFILGFPFQEFSEGEYYRPMSDLFMLIVFNSIWFLVLIAALTPHRQTLLDWARYRQTRTSGRTLRLTKATLRDWILGEKSPAIAALALNLLITIAILTPWIMTWGEPTEQLQGLISLLLNATFMLICAAIAQLILFSSSKRRSVFALAIVGGLIALPPIMMLTIGLRPDQGSLPWIWSCFSFVSIQSASKMTILLGLLGQLLVLTGLSAGLTHQLRRAGESEMKALMAKPHKSITSNILS